MVVAVPLTVYLRDAIRQAQERSSIQKVLKDELTALYSEAVVNDFQINFGIGSSPVEIEATVYLPEGGYLTVAQKNKLSEDLSEAVNGSISLQLNVVDTLLLRRQEDENLRELRSQVENYLVTQLKQFDGGVEIENVQVSQEDIENENSKLIVMMTIRKFSDVKFTFEQKKSLQDGLTGVLGRDVELEVDFIPLTRVRSQDEKTKLINSAKDVIIQDMLNISELSAVSDVKLEEKTIGMNSRFLQIQTEIWLPEDTEFKESDRLVIENHLSQDLEQPVKLEVALFTFKTYQAVWESTEATVSAEQAK
jgi:hypothetical protein